MGPKTTCKRRGEMSPLKGVKKNSYPFIRSFIGVITPFITIVGAQWGTSCYTGFKEENVIQ